MLQIRTWLSLALLAMPGVLPAQDTANAPPKIRRNPDLISTQEIEAAPDAARTAHDLVKQLRPTWLSIRGPSSMSTPTLGPQVYVDGVRRLGVRSLAEIPRLTVREIRHLRGTDATQRYGLDHENGAILVTTK